MTGPGQIVVLNGTSSAGKTSTAAAFQAIRSAEGECWIVVAQDDYSAKLPRQWVEVGKWVGPFAEDGFRLETHGDRAHFHIGEQARRLFHAYRCGVRETAVAGLNVVVDDVTLEEYEWRDWHEVLHGLDPIWVALRCDVEVGVQRETARGDRALGLVRDQAELVHRFPAYDLELDTTETPVDDVARRLDEFLRGRTSR